LVEGTQIMGIPSFACFSLWASLNYPGYILAEGCKHVLNAGGEQGVAAEAAPRNSYRFL